LGGQGAACTWRNYSDTFSSDSSGNGDTQELGVAWSWEDLGGRRLRSRRHIFQLFSNKTRAEITLELLQELNPDVQGKWKHVESLHKVELDSVLSCPNPLVVAADLEPSLLQKLSQKCTEMSISLIVVQSYGMIGVVRLQTPPLPLLEPKPANEPPDLRLVNPFPAFTEFAQSIDLDQLDNAQHGHVPYPVLLWRTAQSWKDRHDGSLPSTYAEKQDFQKSIQEASRKWDMELNFQEASQNFYLAYTEREVDVDRLKELQSQSESQLPKLHAMISGLLTFLERHDGAAPIQGTIPDMTASTESYIKLQQLYHDKALLDFQELRSLVSLSLVSDEELETFCRNVFSLDLFHTSTLTEELEGNPNEEMVDEWSMVTMDPYEVPEHTPLLWYVALRACNVFFTEHGRYPGVLEDYETDVPLLQECIKAVANKMQLQDNELVRQTFKENKFAMEMTRYANAEIHAVASVLGGVASQEAVKIITGQYVPLNNTFVYNGIASVGGVYKF